MIESAFGNKIGFVTSPIIWAWAGLAIGWRSQQGVAVKAFATGVAVVAAGVMLTAALAGNRVTGISRVTLGRVIILNVMANYFN